MTSAEKNRNAYDLWASTYDLDRPPHSHLEERYLLELADVQKSDTVLDAACGTGRYAHIFANLGARVVGCDISERMLEIARAKTPDAQFHIADLNGAIPFPDQFFSRVICSLAIRHIENLRGFLKETKRILRPGGVFVFSTIHPEMDWKTYERSNPPPIDLNKEGITFQYSLSDLERSVKDAGLTLRKTLEVPADETIRGFLTEKSFRLQQGGKFVLLFQVEK